MMCTKENIAAYLKGLLYGSLLAFLFLIPFPHVTALAELSFYISVTCAVYLVAVRALTLRVRTPLILPMLLFALWAAASSFWAPDFGENLLSVYKHFIKMIVLYVLLVSVFTQPKDFRRLIWVLVSSVACYALWAIVQDYILLGNSLIGYRLHPDPQINTNRMGHFCVVAFILALSLWREETHLFRRSAVFFMACIIMSGLLLTYSRTAMLATICGLAVLAWHRRREALVMLMLMAFFVVLLFSFSSIWQHKYDRLLKGNDPRVSIYATYLSMISEMPMIGYGFESDLKVHWKRSNERLPSRFRMIKAYERPHNFILDVTVRLGIVGAFLYGTLLIICIRMGFRLAKRGKSTYVRWWGLGIFAAYSALYTAGLVGNIFHPKTEIIMFSLMAMLTVLWYQDAGEQRALGEIGTDTPA